MFKTGQLVVAINKDPTGKFKKGEVFTVKGIAPSKCECFEYIIDIGLTGNNNKQYCLECNATQITDTSVRWFSNRQFAPVDYTFARMLLRDIEYEIEKLETIETKSDLLKKQSN